MKIGDPIQVTYCGKTGYAIIDGVHNSKGAHVQVPTEISHNTFCWFRPVHTCGSCNYLFATFARDEEIEYLCPICRDKEDRDSLADQPRIS